MVVLDFPCYLAADGFLQKKVLFVCVFSIRCELGECLFPKGTRERVSSISPRWLKSGLCGGWRDGERDGQGRQLRTLSSHRTFLPNITLSLPDIPVPTCPHHEDARSATSKVCCVPNPPARSYFHPSFSDPVNTQCPPQPSSSPGAEVRAWKASLCPNRARRTWCG